MDRIWHCQDTLPNAHLPVLTSLVHYAVLTINNMSAYSTGWVAPARTACLGEFTNEQCPFFPHIRGTD